MDRREIENIEAHVANARQMPLHIAEGAVPVRIIAHGARKEFVPAGKAAFQPVGVNRVQTGTCREGARIDIHHLLRDLGREQQRDLVFAR